MEVVFQVTPIELRAIWGKGIEWLPGIVDLFVPFPLCRCWTTNARVI